MPTGWRRDCAATRWRPLGLALLGSVAALVAQAVTVAPDAALPTAVGETLTGTRYGQIWLIRLVGLLLVTVAVVVGLRGRAALAPRGALGGHCDRPRGPGPVQPPLPCRGAARGAASRDRG